MLALPTPEPLSLDDLLARAAGRLGCAVAPLRPFAFTPVHRVEIRVAIGQRPVVGVQLLSRYRFGNRRIGTIVHLVGNTIAIAVDGRSV